MDISIVTTLINDVGFPIFVCCLLAFGVKYVYDTMLKRDERFAEAIDNNTLIITKLYERMYGEDEHN